jgi:DNA-directed RNA polymerase subunit RPC12/RpoP
VKPGPSPLLQDWIQIPYFPWLVLGCIAAAVLVIFTVNIVRVWEEDDAANQYAQDDHTQQQVNRYHCAAHGCAWHLAEDDRVYVCGRCGARVIRDADVYDQESGVA